MTRTDFAQIRKDVVKDMFLKFTIVVLIFILLRFLILPLCPEMIQTFWNYIITFIFDVFSKLISFLIYEIPTC